MDDLKESSLPDDLLSLVRAGCRIEIVPENRSHGTIYVTVRIYPPVRPESTPLARTELPVAPILGTFHVYYDTPKFAELFRDARRLFIPPKST